MSMTAPISTCTNPNHGYFVRNNIPCDCAITTTVVDDRLVDCRVDEVPQLPFVYASAQPVMVALSAGEVRNVLDALHKQFLANMKARVDRTITIVELDDRNDALEAIARKLTGR